ncbi:MAG TPA: hypothetical protein VK776_30005 [Bryobacteraceae bacterium]|nr:hypothetical protein [Bryobacteraceae bacterium]
MQSADSLEVNVAGCDKKAVLTCQGGDPSVIAGNRRSSDLQLASKFRESPSGVETDDQQVEKGQIGLEPALVSRAKAG